MNQADCFELTPKIAAYSSRYGSPENVKMSSVIQHSTGTGKSQTIFSVIRKTIEGEPGTFPKLSVLAESIRSVSDL